MGSIDYQITSISGRKRPVIRDENIDHNVYSHPFCNSVGSTIRAKIPISSRCRLSGSKWTRHRKRAPLFPKAFTNKQDSISVTSNEMKYIRASHTGNTEILLDLKNDPGEHYPLRATESDEIGRLRKILEEHLSTTLKKFNRNLTCKRWAARR